VRLVVIQPVAESVTAGVRGTKMKERKERRKQKKKRGYSVFYIYHITAPTPSVNNQFSEPRYVAINTCGIVNHGSTLGGNGTVTTGCLPLHKPDLQGAKQRLPSDGSHVHSFGVIRTPRNENRSTIDYQVDSNLHSNGLPAITAGGSTITKTDPLGQ